LWGDKLANILVIDDDEDLLRIVRRTLETSGHDVTTHLSVPQIEVEEYLKYHLVLLDVMLPGENGFDYCARIRSRVNCPILFMSARNSEHDLSKGLLLGGDEYIKKPFSIIELRARVEAHLRRENRILQTKQKFGNIELTIQSKELYVGEKLVKLTKSEYEICEFLVLNRGHTFSRSQIYDKVFGFNKDTYETVIVEHIKNLRAKLLEFGENPIKTVWGIGYKWDE